MAPHPIMFDEDDPLLAKVRAIAAALPGTDEKVSHGRPALFTKKIFAIYGGSLKVGDEWVQHPHSVLILTDADERPALLAQEDTFVPGYWGPSGWIGIDLGAKTDWDEIAELIDASYRLTASKKLIKELDAAT